MTNRLKNVITEWSAEVEEEAIILIQNGVPPYEAQERARLMVSSRRKLKTEND